LEVDVGSGFDGIERMRQGHRLRAIAIVAALPGQALYDAKRTGKNCLVAKALDSQ